jgi:hypothetical protein
MNLFMQFLQVEKGNYARKQHNSIRGLAHQYSRNCTSRSGILPCPTPYYIGICAGLAFPLSGDCMISIAKCFFSPKSRSEFWQ